MTWSRQQRQKNRIRREAREKLIAEAKAEGRYREATSMCGPFIELDNVRTLCLKCDTVDFYLPDE